MNQTQPLVQNISDTALWSAVYRARESERPDALFHDRFARRLTGTRGEQIAQNLKVGGADSAFGAIRTYLFDQFIMESVRRGVDMVISLAAGLDASPYRLELPSDLTWIEVDLPDMISHKEEALRGERPVCRLERVKLDLVDVEARRDLFRKLAQRTKKALIITEGLLIYLAPEEVASLANDLAAHDSFRYWALELSSPGLLKMIQKKTEKTLKGAGAQMKFGPEQGPHYFSRYGWKAIDVRSMMKTAAKLKRLPFVMRLLAKLPESNGHQGSRPWAGVCLFERQ